MKRHATIITLLILICSCATQGTRQSARHPLENQYTLQNISRKEYLQKGLIPLKDFFKNPQIANVKISPNGEYLSYLKPWKNRLNIYVRRIDSKEERRITKQTKRNISYYGWKGDETLLFFGDSAGDENFHIYRTSADGKDKQDLTPFKDVTVRMVDWLENISQDEIMIVMNKRNKQIFDVYRLNILTGSIALIAENPGTFSGWMTDNNGKLRVAIALNGLNKSIHYRDKEGQDFKKIFQTDFKNKFSPFRFDTHNKNLYVASNISGDKTSIQLFNPRNKTTVSTIFSHPEVDASDIDWSRKDKKITCILYTTWKTHRKCIHPRWKNIHTDLKKRFPKKTVYFTSLDAKENKGVLHIYSDRLSGRYYLYDINTGQLKKIGDTRPWLDEKQLARMKPIQYKSRDGLIIHGYLTLPKNSSGKNLPLVVNPHGGPWSRNYWGYNSQVQFLANRGYAVLQMNFRGSTGYGRKFWEAGFKQWGRAMQDDITDGVRHLIKKGIADKRKICIYGGSYGGYATLAGVAFTPDLYTCGVNMVGVSNIFTFMESIPPYWELARKKMHEQIGHPKKDNALLKAISPFFHIDKIKAPLLIVHGANDPRVKKAESDQIVSGLHKRGIKPIYMVKYNEGHGFRLEENRIEFYRLMEQFLEEHLMGDSRP